jgi:hypothetical protein
MTKFVCFWKQAMDHFTYLKYMNFRLWIGLVALASMVIVSCHPYSEDGRRKPRKNPSTQQISETGNVEPVEPAGQAVPNMIQTVNGEVSVQQLSPPPVMPAPVPQDTLYQEVPKVQEVTKPEVKNYPVAKKVVGRPGLVYSPYTQAIVSVKNPKTGQPYPSGQKMAESTDMKASGKYFLVP